MNKNTYEGRKLVIIGIFILIGMIFIVRLFFVQVVNKKYVLSATNNVLRYVTQYPARGLVYDRNGNLLVYNEAAYDLMVIPKQVEEIDTIEFCKLIGIEKEDFIINLQRAKKYSSHKASIFEEQISKENYGYLEERLYRYPGFYVQPRTLRKYPIAIAAHTLGYVGEVNQREIEKGPYYRMGDYIGKSGVEKAYEDELRGKKGLKIKIVDVFNREKGSYMDGRFDTLAVTGNDLFLTIDAGLQAYGEKLMKNKKGSIVAIEPSTGEILALITSPAYDPNLLIGRVRSENYNLLYEDTLKPLFNRALLAMYPPGSSFKPMMALIGLQEGVLTRATEYPCAGETALPIKCSHNHDSPLDLVHAIEQSCNPYFWNVFKSVVDNPKYSSIRWAFIKWREYMTSFNLGVTFDSDLLVERGGNVPQPEYYDKYFGKNVWRSMTIRSLSIGQGELLITPMQLANLSAILANRGFYYKPHIVRAIKEDGEITTLEFEKKQTLVEAQYFDPVIEGMHLVYSGEHGTARWYAPDTIAMCGKTGTVQNPHGENHSVFFAFAPMDSPQIAISVIVENGGYGSKYGAPIATLMMEKYILGEFKKPWFEKKMLEDDLIGRGE
ncbi:MAG: penicillin-binding protein 2 [Bacteroidetes bacterium 4484_276]|nr:MAG: penicillin-binding protein 2 [Bacteroidetes bacterium 4484_276]